MAFEADSLLRKVNRRTRDTVIHIWPFTLWLLSVFASAVIARPLIANGNGTISSYHVLLMEKWLINGLAMIGRNEPLHHSGGTPCLVAVVFWVVVELSLVVDCCVDRFGCRLLLCDLSPFAVCRSNAPFCCATVFGSA